MKDEQIILVMGVDFGGPPESEEKFNTWYIEEHVPLMLRSKWVKGAVRHKLIHVIAYEGKPLPGQPKYLAIYEFQDRQAFDDFLSGPELSAAISARRETYTDEVFKVKWGAAFETTKVWEK
jgi:hypothetical protein